MCDFSVVAGLLTSASLAITVATIAIGVAIATNAGFFTAGGSPAAMITAGISTLAAAGFLIAANVAVTDFFNCMITSNPGISACAGQLTNFSNNISAIITTLGIQATACFATAGIAWIPWAGQVPMWVIIGSLTVQAALIPSLIVFFNNLKDCVNSASASNVIPGWPVFFLAVAAIAVIVVGIYGAAKGGLFSSLFGKKG